MTALFIVRLSPWCLEVIRTDAARQWNTCVATFEKRRDAERFVKAHHAEQGS